MKCLLAALSSIVKANGRTNRSGLWLENLARLPGIWRARSGEQKTHQSRSSGAADIQSITKTFGRISQESRRVGGSQVLGRSRSGDVDNSPIRAY